ncbi:PQ loop repeat protein [Trichuris suis]|nr:PQ loop repeat protein [Trichuris suis]
MYTAESEAIMIVQLIHELIVFLFPKDCFEELILKFNIFNSKFDDVLCAFFAFFIVLVSMSHALGVNVAEKPGIGTSWSSKSFFVGFSSSDEDGERMSPVPFEFVEGELDLSLLLPSEVVLADSDDGFDFLSVLCFLFLFDGPGLQALENYRNKSTGQLSAITFSLLLLGSLARIFTSIQETGDPVIIMQYAVSSAMNAIICWQIYAYWGRRMPLKKTE